MWDIGNFARCKLHTSISLSVFILLYHETAQYTATCAIIGRFS